MAVSKSLTQQMSMFGEERQELSELRETLAKEMEKRRIAEEDAARLRKQLSGAVASNAKRESSNPVADSVVSRPDLAVSNATSDLEI